MKDREKVIKGLECHAEVNCVECPYRDGWRTCPFGETLLADALSLLKEQEAVVHCKDCKHWQRRECGGYGTCDYGYLDGFFDADWFCANGERKEWR